MLDKDYQDTNNYLGEAIEVVIEVDTNNNLIAEGSLIYCDGYGKLQDECKFRKNVRLIGWDEEEDKHVVLFTDNTYILSGDSEPLSKNSK